VSRPFTDDQFVAGFHFFAGALERCQRQDAFALETDIEENRLGGDSNYRAFDLSAAVFGLVRMALLELGKKLAE